jgi:GST-like protein
MAMMESGAILVYLASKVDRFLPRTVRGKYETLQWLMFQVGGIGPMFGQVGYFYKFEGRSYEDKRPLEHYVDEAKHILGVLDQRLRDRTWMMGDDYTIADIAIFPMVRNLIGYYKAGELVGIDVFPNVTRSLETFMARPAVARGIAIPRS